MLRLICVTLAAAFLISCTQPKAPSEGHPTIQAYSNAYNEKDIKTMRALMHPDIEWVGIEDNEIEVHVSGQQNLAEAMEGWFKNPKLPKGALRDWSINGDHVAVTETAYWTTDAGEDKSQSALTVYQLKDGLIRRVYYYPETKH